MSSQPVGVGDQAPDFTLRNQSGLPVHLADALAEGPVVLAFYFFAFTGG